MKKYSSILKRVTKYEDKCGIHYAKTSGLLYKCLRVVSSIVSLYLLFVNTILLFSLSMRKQASGDMVVTDQEFNYLVIAVFLVLFGAILFYTRFKITASIISIIPLPIFSLIYMHTLEDGLGYFGYSVTFYWQHLIPATLMIIIVLWLFVIALRERIKVNRQYKRIITNLYGAYTSIKRKDNDFISDEEWDEFLKNYDPKIAHSIL